VRPRDLLGLPLSTTAEAAATYSAGLERLMRLQSGGEELVSRATEMDPEFAVAHATLALLDHEAGVDTDVRAHLRAARAASRVKGDEREQSFVEVVQKRVTTPGPEGNQLLLDYVSCHPRDVLAVSVAVPTIAFSGATDLQEEAWELVDGLSPAYGDHWWYTSLLAFIRQEQARYDESATLAERALRLEPSSAHAVHAMAHVHYETGRHQDGRAWLDRWISQCGRSATHRAHFSWHAALHELAVGDTEGVRRRYCAQLSPPAVAGIRALVDSAALLWRWRVTISDWDEAVGAEPPARDEPFAMDGPPPPVSPVLAVVDRDLLVQPQTPFVALHSAVALAAAGDGEGLRTLRAHCHASHDPRVRSTVDAVCGALQAASGRRWGVAAQALEDVLPELHRVGGSLAQREVVEETLLLCLVQDGQADAALRILDQRLERRPSPLDTRRRRSISPSTARDASGPGTMPT
jgi:tetratricopeptide (TPR) repeat protein